MVTHASTRTVQRPQSVKLSILGYDIAFIRWLKTFRRYMLLADSQTLVVDKFMVGDFRNCPLLSYSTTCDILV